ncbi:TadE/TadG family type IV pilus assembly protein [Jiangella muralis]|uniref:TadE/TadG family type IV pilus assembly protein n=1 Tax=Jiangella muralis TaxID=702383 RepID=UPI00069EC0D0|nr:TadE/TadG family type IV pilus assembly protein [Jiangella muralis]
MNRAHLVRAGRRQRAGRETGSATVELTIATPLLVAVLVFVAVIVHRGVDARLRLDDAAHQAARAASLARSPVAATTAADTTATQALADAGIVCDHMTIATDTARFAPGGVVTVTVGCTVSHNDALFVGIPGHRQLTATFTSPVDTWRATTSADG